MPFANPDRNCAISWLNRLEEVLLEQVLINTWMPRLQHNIVYSEGGLKELHENTITLGCRYKRLSERDHLSMSMMIRDWETKLEKRR